MARFNFLGSFIGGGETGRGGGRTKLFTKTGMFIISFINVIVLSEIIYLYSLHCKLELDANIKPSVQGHKRNEIHYLEQQNLNTMTN